MGNVVRNSVRLVLLVSYLSNIAVVSDRTRSSWPLPGRFGEPGWVRQYKWPEFREHHVGSRCAAANVSHGGRKQEARRTRPDDWGWMLGWALIPSKAACFGFASGVFHPPNTNMCFIRPSRLRLEWHARIARRRRSRCLGHYRMRDGMCSGIPLFEHTMSDFNA